MFLRSDDVHMSFWNVLLRPESFAALRGPRISMTVSFAIYLKVPKKTCLNGAAAAGKVLKLF